MIGAHHSQQVSRRWFFIVLRWVAALVVLGILLHFLPLAPLRAAIAQVPPSRFLAILLGYLLAHSVGIAKWRMVVNAAGAELDFATSAQCYTGGLFGTLFLPSIIGGDVIRLAVGLRRSPRPAAVLAGNVVDRALDVAAQGGLVLLGFVLYSCYGVRFWAGVPFGFAGGWRGSAMRFIRFRGDRTCCCSAGWPGPSCRARSWSFPLRWQFTADSFCRCACGCSPGRWRR